MTADPQTPSTKAGRTFLDSTAYLMWVVDNVMSPTGKEFIR